MTDLFDAAAMYDDDYLHFFAAPPGVTTFASDGPTIPGNDKANTYQTETHQTEPDRNRISHTGNDQIITDQPDTDQPSVEQTDAANRTDAADRTGAAKRTGADVGGLVWRLLGLRPGMRVLDLACGHGALANDLAARGCDVTGLDSSRVFLDRARADAAAAGVDVDYVAGDMRALPWTGRFDRVVNWSTAFGYFDDATNREVLAEIVRVLRPGGRLAMDLDNLPAFLMAYTSSRVVAVRGDGDMLVDRYHLDATTLRFEAERTVVRDGRARRLTFVKRLFAFPELRDWLVAAGFSTVTGHGGDGSPLTAAHRRMIVVGTLP